MGINTYSPIFTIRGPELYKDGFIFLSFPSQIEMFLILANSIVILISHTPSVEDQNVFCYDLSGQLKWQIPKPFQIHAENYFSSIYLNGLDLFAYSICGVEYHIEKESGQVLNSELIK